MTVVYYVGVQDARTIRTSDFIAAGVNDQTTVTFDSETDWQADVSATANTFLLTQEDFDDAPIDRAADVAEPTPILTDLTVRTKTGNYTASHGDVILADATGGSITITLPAAAEGRQVTVKRVNSGSNTVTIDPPGSVTVDGAATLAVGAQWASKTVISDGVNWFSV
jgi:hypothetical protein